MRKANLKMIGMLAAAIALGGAVPLLPETSAQTSSDVAGDTALPGGDLNIFVNLARHAVPSVVNISTLSKMKTGYRGFGGLPLSPGLPSSPGLNSPRELLQEFFGNHGGRYEKPLPKTAALGTGFVVNPSGIILTNNHVVEGADEITVQFTENPEEKPTSAKVIGRDPELDVALIKVKTDRELLALPLGDSDALQVGEYVMTVGNPYGNGHSVSHGIVSAKGRDAPGELLASWIQVDAPINPGNSGGPLLNLRGEVVGINNAIDARAQGIGFAIPINAIKRILPQLEKGEPIRRGYIGAIIAVLTPEIAEKIGIPKDLHAPIVTQVTPGGPADQAGLRAYDVITAVGGTNVRTPRDLVRAITSAGVGESVSLEIIRGGDVRSTLSIRAGQRPSRDSG